MLDQDEIRILGHLSWGRQVEATVNRAATRTALASPREAGQPTAGRVDQAPNQVREPERPILREFLTVGGSMPMHASLSTRVPLDSDSL